MRYFSPFLPMCLSEVLYVDVVWSCIVVVLASFDCYLDLLGCDVYLSWM